MDSGGLISIQRHSTHYTDANDVEISINRRFLSTKMEIDENEDEEKLVNLNKMKRKES
jgi:hypothetical protein